MNAAVEIFTVSTGGFTVLIGPPGAVGGAQQEILIDSPPDVAHYVGLALDARRESVLLRQLCIGWGLDTHNVFYVDDRSLRNWLVNAVRQGRLGLALSPNDPNGRYV